MSEKAYEAFEERFSVPLSQTDRITIGKYLTQWMPDQSMQERGAVLIESIEGSRTPFRGLKALMETARSIARHRYPRPDPVSEGFAQKKREAKERRARNFTKPGDWSTMTREGWTNSGFYHRQYFASRFPEQAEEFAKETGVEVPHVPWKSKPIEKRKADLKSQADAMLEGVEELVQFDGFVDYEEGNGS